MTFPILASLFVRYLVLLLFFFNDTATTEIYTLSLHDALPILQPERRRDADRDRPDRDPEPQDRKSTRLNSSHVKISYAVFCLKKQKKKNNIRFTRKKKKKKNANYNRNNY